jgi:sterol desaturase/sphingolipid hydroxylase (fatty acid hydroxylase superfamily)
MPFGLDIKTLVAAAVLALLWLGESWIPFYAHFKGRRVDRLRHDGRNLALGAFNGVAVALLFGGLLAAVETWSERTGFGLLRFVSWPLWLETAVAFLVFDAWMYVWHRANHELPFLWRFHRMHHSDSQMDATTGVRFHTGEVLLSGCLRLGVLALAGMALWQLVIYEAIMLPIVLLHHSNVRLPRWLDYGLLALIVTPAMHRVHHSRIRRETDSNYGSVFPWWDLLAGSFRLRADARTVRLGLDELDDPRWQRLSGMLITPLA